MACLCAEPLFGYAQFEDKAFCFLFSVVALEALSLGAVYGIA